MYKFGIIGVGKMGYAILKGILNKNIFTKEEIILHVHSKERREYFNSLGFNTSFDLSYCLENSEVVLLSIKPQIYDEIINKEYSVPCIISVMAGKRIKDLKKHFSKSFIVRSMPNTPSMINEGVTTVSFESKSSKYYNLSKEILESISKIYEIDENLSDTLLPLNGSMPAYFNLFVKSFIDASIEHNVPYELVKNLLLDSIEGSLKLLRESSESIDDQIKNVCSKGGTTIAGLNKLYEGSFQESIKECYEACRNRSIELSNNN
ncbi:pyrroline-5-carboxylate reductase [bacterium]|nr:pyrroline-5-carboxylate reductase [bacterium]